VDKMVILQEIANCIKKRDMIETVMMIFLYKRDKKLWMMGAHLER
jgi:hypothetical protein